MKHIRLVSKPPVRPAQMAPEQIVALVVSILSAATLILTAVVPLIGDKD